VLPINPIAIGFVDAGQARMSPIPMMVATVRRNHDKIFTIKIPFNKIMRTLIVN
jgi:hypothetical protein